MEANLNSMWSEERKLSASHEQVQENAWVASSQRGDTLAFNRLVLKWERAIYNVSLRMLQDPDEAEEATQEVFLNAFKNIRRFRQDSRFSTWLYRIAVNHCISRARRRPPGTFVSIHDQNDNEVPAPQLHVRETQEGALLKRESRVRVRNALAFLPAEQRAVIELKFFQERTFEDMAAILETPLSTVKSRFYTALESLKTRLGGKA